MGGGFVDGCQALVAICLLCAPPRGVSLGVRLMAVPPPLLPPDFPVAISLFPPVK